ncbi:MAG: isoprenylcysteine carboxylmethyltransferase family protein [Brevundimonas sp.]|nr:MAG: isoprenylcysteine carboxylmethyltransferase family protein [Brevundimonas sp.]
MYAHLPDLRAVQRRRKYVVAACLIPLLALVVTTGSAWPGEAPVGEIIEGVGLLMIGVAIIGRAWCSLYIGGRKTHELVQDGPYALTRNPLYVFSFIGAFGVGAQTGSLTLAALFAAAAVAVFLPVIAREEQFLGQAFAGSYADYRRRTPRLLPDFRLWRPSEALMVQPAFFLRTLADGLPFLLAWPLFELVSRWQDSGLSPLLRLP